MFTAVPKKPPSTTGSVLASSSDQTIPPSTLFRASRSSASGPLAVSAAPPRIRSTRTGLVSARAAAYGNVPGSTSGANAELAQLGLDARAEAAGKLQELHDQLAANELDRVALGKRTEALQAKLDEAVGDCSRLEERAHEIEEQAEALRHEKRESLRQTRELEAIYEAERSSMIKERDEMATREEEMQAVIQRLKDSLSQRDDDGRPSRQAANHSPSIDGGFAPPSSLTRSDSRNNSKLVLQKDKLIESLRLELAETQIKLVELENLGGGRLQEVEKQLIEGRMANARLLEDIDGYQLLLEEKTMTGEFGKAQFMSAVGSRLSMGSPSLSPTAAGDLNGVVTANQEALNALEGKSGGVIATERDGRPPSLEEELSKAAADAARGEGGDIGTGSGDGRGGSADEKASAHQQKSRRLEADLKLAKEQNKAMNLYISTIIGRVLENHNLEHILEQPTGSAKAAIRPVTSTMAAPPTLQVTGASLLQRARSIAVGRAPGALKSRPMSCMPGQAQQSHIQQQVSGLSSASSSPSAHTDPDRAPSIPIGNLTRSNSSRRSRPMSEQPLSAGHPQNHHSLHVQQQRHSHRDPPPSPPPSGLTRANTATNPVQPQSKARSEASSSSASESTELTTPPRTPPRSTSGGAGGTAEKMTTLAGNKPRPLRLVRENPESVRSAGDAVSGPGSAKRASWMGWAASWGSKKEDGLPTEMSIQE